MIQECFMLSMTDHVREALVTAALFGTIGAAFARTASEANNSGDVPSTRLPAVPGHHAPEEPSTRQVSR
jgi:hypothetical protein